MMGFFAGSIPELCHSEHTPGPEGWPGETVCRDNEWRLDWAGMCTCAHMKLLWVWKEVKQWQGWFRKEVDEFLGQEDSFPRTASSSSKLQVGEF